MRPARVRTRVDLSILPRRRARLVRARETEELRSALSDVAAILRASPGLQLADLPEPSEAATDDIDRGERAIIAGLRARSWSITRSPLSEADRFTVELPAGVLPIDLRIIRGASVDLWRFIHETNAERLQDREARCKPGDEGHIRGVVVDAERDHETASTLRLVCEDMTALPRRTYIDGDALDGAPIDQTLVEVVRYLIRQMPGGDQWYVVGRGSMADGVPDKALGTERVRKKRSKTIMRVEVDTSAFGAKPQAATGRTADDGVSQAGRVYEIAERPSIDVKTTFETRRANPGFSPSKGLRTLLRWVGIRPSTISIPADTYRTHVSPTAADVFGDAQTVWDAITSVCARMACVPEVAIAQDGAIVIYVCDLAEVQAGGALRTFEREGQAYRVATVGVDTPGGMSEQRAILPRRESDPVDAVEVYSIHPDTGDVLTARYGRAGGAVRRIPAHGVTDQAMLNRKAEAVWTALAMGEFRLDVPLLHPWTTGGGPDDPDAFGIASGTALGVRFRGADRLRGADLERVLRDQGLPTEAARILASASEEVPVTMVFHVQSYSEQGDASGSTWSATATCSTFLDDGEEVSAS